VICHAADAFVQIKKSFRGNYPLTTCEITPKGIDACGKYVDVIEEYFKSFLKMPEGIN
jgi:hypothetical protein